MYTRGQFVHKKNPRAGEGRLPARRYPTPTGPARSGIHPTSWNGSSRNLASYRRCKEGRSETFGVGTRITRGGVVVDGRIEVELEGMKPHIEFVAFVLIVSAVVLLVYLFL